MRVLTRFLFPLILLAAGVASCTKSETAPMPPNATTSPTPATPQPAPTPMFSCTGAGDNGEDMETTPESCATWALSVIVAKGDEIEELKKVHSAELATAACPECPQCPSSPAHPSTPQRERVEANDTEEDLDPASMLMQCLDKKSDFMTLDWDAQLTLKSSKSEEIGVRTAALIFEKCQAFAIKCNAASEQLMDPDTEDDKDPLEDLKTTRDQVDRRLYEIELACLPSLVKIVTAKGAVPVEVLYKSHEEEDREPDHAIYGEGRLGATVHLLELLKQHQMDPSRIARVITNAQVLKSWKIGCSEYFTYWGSENETDEQKDLRSDVLCRIDDGRFSNKVKLPTGCLTDEQYKFLKCDGSSDD